MERLADYLKKLSAVLGHEKHIHLMGVIEEATLSALIEQDEEVSESVKTRVQEASRGKGPKEAVNGFRDLSADLQRQNWRGELIEEGENPVVLQEFTAQETTPQTEAFGPFWERGSLDGYVIRIEGTDKTDHISLVYEGFKGKCEMNESLARRIAPFYRSKPIRVFGKGRWIRHASGEWELLSFEVDDFEPLEDITLNETVARLRAIPENGLNSLEDPIAEMQKIRSGDY